MSFKSAMKSWNARQHLYVLGIGLLIYVLFAVAFGFVAIAYFMPEVFLAIVALGLLSYLTGMFFSVLLLGRDKDET